MVEKRDTASRPWPDPPELAHMPVQFILGYRQAQEEAAAEITTLRAQLAARQPAGDVEAVEAQRKALIDAIQAWAGDNEGTPNSPSDARLLKALWTYEGDHTTPCDECDGECGEPCAPCTVAQAHAQLDHWIASHPEREAKKQRDRAAFVRLAVVAEREECAKVAEQQKDTYRGISPYAAGYMKARSDIAAAIRAKGDNNGN